MVEKHIDTAKAPCFRVRDNEPELLLLLHKPRKGITRQKNGKRFEERIRWGYPGGQGNPLERSLIKIIIREAWEETETVEGEHLVLIPEMFSEDLAVHGPVLPSQRDDGSETYQNHFYPILLPPETEIGEIDPNNEEIIRGEWFRLYRLPAPDDAIPFTQTQFFALEQSLELMAQKWDSAVPWLEMVQKQVDEYQARRDRYRR
ncbi:MAG: NUDIX domain-containing protein [Candidatus Paceibacterota bacterium]|jgi:8-oxo-dGTP pyrophosphatase MutT (NUDIX family)|nr:NUDIX domain-containing protein [Candidatus Paceibacterota bacterium]